MKPGELRELEIAPEFTNLLYLMQRRRLKEKMDSKPSEKDLKDNVESEIKKRIIRNILDPNADKKFALDKIADALE